MMHTPGIELPYAVTFASVEAAHRRTMRYKREDTETNRSKLRQAMRAVKARDRKLLLVLEKATEALDAQAENQSGRTRRDHTTAMSERGYPMEAGVWKVAYEALLKGQDIDVFGWTYVGACELAGIIA